MLLPPLLHDSMFPALGLLTLRGIGLSPTCFSQHKADVDMIKHPFAFQIGVFSSAIFFVVSSVIIYAFSNTKIDSHRAVRRVGSVSLACVLVLLPLVSELAASMLTCRVARLSLTAIAALNGGPVVVLNSALSNTSVIVSPSSYISSLQTISLLSYDPRYVCFAGSHAYVGYLALITLVLCVFIGPVIIVVILIRDARLTMQRHVRRDLASTCHGGKNGIVSCLRIRSSAAVVPTSQVEDAVFLAVSPLLRHDGASNAPSSESAVFQHAHLHRMTHPHPIERVSGTEGRISGLELPDMQIRQAPTGQIAKQVEHALPPTDPMVGAALGPYAPKSWMMSIIDPVSVIVIGIVEGVVPRPSTSSEMWAKSSISLAVIGMLLYFVIFTRPFAKGHNWRYPVRISLLVLSGLCVLITLAAGSMQLGWWDGAGFAAGATGVFIAVASSVVVLLVGGWSWHIYCLGAQLNDASRTDDVKNAAATSEPHEIPAASPVHSPLSETPGADSHAAATEPVPSGHSPCNTPEIVERPILPSPSASAIRPLNITDHAIIDMRDPSVFPLSPRARTLASHMLPYVALMQPYLRLHLSRGKLDSKVDGGLPQVVAPLTSGRLISPSTALARTVSSPRGSAPNASAKGNVSRSPSNSKRTFFGRSPRVPEKVDDDSRDINPLPAATEASSSPSNAREQVLQHLNAERIALPIIPVEPSSSRSPLTITEQQKQQHDPRTRDIPALRALGSALPGFVLPHPSSRRLDLRQQSEVDIPAQTQLQHSHGKNLPNSASRLPASKTPAPGFRDVISDDSPRSASMPVPDAPFAQEELPDALSTEVLHNGATSHTKLPNLILQHPDHTRVASAREVVEREQTQPVVLSARPATKQTLLGHAIVPPRAQWAHAVQAPIGDTDPRIHRMLQEQRVLKFDRAALPIIPVEPSSSRSPLTITEQQKQQHDPRTRDIPALRALGSALPGFVLPHPSSRRLDLRQQSEVDIPAQTQLQHSHGKNLPNSASRLPASKTPAPGFRDVISDDSPRSASMPVPDAPFAQEELPDALSTEVLHNGATSHTKLPNLILQHPDHTRVASAREVVEREQTQPMALSARPATKQSLLGHAIVPPRAQWAHAVQAPIVGTNPRIHRTLQGQHMPAEV